MTTTAIKAKEQYQRVIKELLRLRNASKEDYGLEKIPNGQEHSVAVTMVPSKESTEIHALYFSCSELLEGPHAGIVVISWILMVRAHQKAHGTRHLFSYHYGRENVNGHTVKRDFKLLEKFFNDFLELGYGAKRPVLSASAVYLSNGVPAP